MLEGYVSIIKPQGDRRAVHMKADTANYKEMVRRGYNQCVAENTVGRDRLGQELTGVRNGIGWHNLYGANPIAPCDRVKTPDTASQFERAAD